MNTIIKHLQSHEGVCDYKINLDRKESYELFAFYGTPEQLELLVKNNGDRINGISFAYMSYDL